MKRLLPIIAILPALGCREPDPPPTQFEDLGTAGAPLLPTTPVWKTAAIAEGQAEWHPFREPETALEDGEIADADAVEAPAGGSPAGEADSETATAIRSVIDEFNEVTRTGAAIDILDYFVAEQVDALKPIIDAVLATRDVLRELRGELEAKLPDAADRIERATSVILGDMSLELRDAAIDVRSEQEAVVTVARGVLATEHRFVIVDDQWYLRVADEAALAALGPALDRGLQYYREMLDGVRSGGQAAEDRLKELESAVAAAQQAAAEDAEDAAAPEEPPDDDGDGD